MVQTDHRYLMSGLLEGWDWFDNGLQNILRLSGFPTLNKSQSMMVLYISAGIQRPIEIARKMRLSRQAIRHIANQLIDLELIVMGEDASDGRSKILAFTNRSNDIRHFAHDAIFQLEAVLRGRIGREDYDMLRRVLSLDWGNIVKTEEDMLAAKTSGKPARGVPAASRKKHPAKRRHAAA